MNKSSKYLSLLLSFLLIASCSNDKQREEKQPIVKIIGAMKEVMWKGQLQSQIDLDTITNRKGLIGLGPESYLRGEIMILDGESYVSRVEKDSSLKVERSFDLGAPFFVYSNVLAWSEMKVPADIKSISDFEKWMQSLDIDLSKPMAFKIEGSIDSAIIHAQNLAPGTTVSSPKEAHQGQVNYNLSNSDVQIAGFFSREHQGIFTHHDSFVHLHLITKDKSIMGHLDKVSFKEVVLFVPET